ncbi:von Willebrand factor type A domain-containing protein [Anatilimnocola sp. NA78]|uniref:vWA domain-containing protein n=1 Tax=Anatilimnocola sp. NA78 TaxID=3415683 RepID=UPI003CE523FA
MKSNSHSDDLSNGSDPFSQTLRDSLVSQPLPTASSDLRAALLARLDQPAVTPVSLSPAVAARRRTFFQRAAIALVGTAAAIMAAVIWQRPAGSVLSWSDLSEPQPSAVSSRGNLPADPAAASTLQGHSLLPDLYGDVSGAGESARSETRTVTRTDLASLEEEVDSKFYSTRLPESYGERNESAPYGNMPAKGPAGPVVTTAPGIEAAEYSLAEKKEALVPESKDRPTTWDRRVKERELTPSADDQLQRTGDNSGGAATAVPALGTAASKRLSVIAGTSVSGDRPSPATDSAPYSGPSGGIAGSGKEAPSEAQLQQLAKREEEVRRDTKSLTDLAIKDAEKNSGDWYEQRGKGIDRLSTLDAKAVELTVRTGEAKNEPADEDRHFRYIAPGVQTGEQYAKIIENHFKAPTTQEEALSTFAIDVDTASYANVRRFLNNGQLPPPDAVRIEELVNYFKYKYPQPKGDTPFSVNLEMADCPWQPGHKLLRVGLQGKEIHKAERPPSNIVFLVDTSGSMTDASKLALLKQSFTLMVGELNENDKVTIVTYAGNAGLRLPPTRGDQKETIIAAIEGMQSGGSTHGSAGIELAYEHAAAQFIKDGTNKVILATDGDLNVGVTDDAELIKLITKKAETGVYLTVLGVGTGNLKDAKMEQLADSGNGIYAYLDSVREARKVLVEQMSGSLVTIAKDVKIQVEFNPKHIQGYRLLGYENRVMANQDFRNDAKDAGEIGAGHSVTAIYEVALVGAEGVKKVSGETLRYQRPIEKPALEPTKEGMSDELLMVRLRYKQPEATKETEATELKFPLKDKGGNFNSASGEFQFASAVAAFGLVLRGSEYRGSANLSAVAEIAGAATSEDPNGHRAEFLDMVRKAKTLRGN